MVERSDIDVVSTWSGIQALMQSWLYIGASVIGRGLQHKIIEGLDLRITTQVRHD